MKSSLKMRLILMVCTSFLLLVSAKLFSQELTKMCPLTETELKAKFKMLTASADVKKLGAELSSKGFEKLTTAGTSYGFTGTFKDAGGKSLPVEFYAFDYYNKSTNQMGSVIWRNDGKSVYKAYLLFPIGEKDFEKALDGSEEMFVDAKGNIQKASSFGKCWKKCVFKNCAGWCIGAIAICAAATATIAIASAGPTAGIGVGAAVAIFAGCAGISCATCFGVCAVGCF